MRRTRAVTLAATTLAALATATPALATDPGCKAFGQNVASLPQTFGGATFGQITASNAPANDTVENEQGDCGGQP